MEIFKAVDISKQYGRFRALDRVSLAVPEGTVYGLLGPNGAGKTTLIRIINQIFAPDGGELFFKGRKMHADDIFKIGYLPEERGLYKKMKVGEQAVYLARLKGLSKPDAVQRLKRWFTKFEMESWWNKKVEDLSKGMQQKVQFVITVLHEPELLIFDEPFSGFDPINATLLKNEILDLKKNGATIIFSTHNMSSVEELCDNITLINKSKSILDGEVTDIKERYKTGEYEVTFRGDFEKVKNSLNAYYNILSYAEEKGMQNMRVKVVGNRSDNELLSLILPHIHIISFNEVYPSMNDIFINVVGASNQNDF